MHIGQVAEGARARGASKIIGVDINPDKFITGNLIYITTSLKLSPPLKCIFSVLKAQAMGITDFVNPTDKEKPVYEVGVFSPLLSHRKYNHNLHIYFH